MKTNSFHQVWATTLLLGCLLGVMTRSAAVAQTNNQTPPNFKIAILGDGGLVENARAVLQLVKNEGAQAVVHSGDVEVKKGSVAEWEALLTEILGADFPYFFSIGDDDGEYWDGPAGIQQTLMNRLNRAGVTWSGDFGIKSSLQYKGIFFILVAPDIRDTGHDTYIREQLAADNSIWSICSWHKNMHNLQVCDKPDGTGYGVYEEARLGGALIATGHCHAYARTHLLSNMANQTIASTSLPLEIEKGKSFVLISGLAGEGGRSDQGFSGNWWAKIYTKAQNSQYGSLFATFNVDGIPNKANFYFKNIDGVVVESYTVISNVEAIPPSCEVAADFSASPTSGCNTLSVDFADLSTGPVTSWLWDFGDGATSSEQNPFHSYGAAGIYTVQLTVNSNSCSDSETKSRLITVSGAPTAAFTGSPASGNAPLTVNFTDQSTGNPTAWSWNFGDGGTSTSQNPSHTYNVAGNYTVTLNITSSCGSDGETKVNYIAVTTTTPSSGNLALKKPATASSVYQSYTPDRAVDGINTGTSYWRSVSGSKSTPNTWLRVDLGATYKLARAVVKWKENYFARRYRFQISNTGGSGDNEWTTVATVTNGAVGTQDVPLNSPLAARYFRIRMDQNNKDKNQIYELECYAEGSAPKTWLLEEKNISDLKAPVLHPGYPNPFNPSTTLWFELPHTMRVILKIYNLGGQEMATLVEGELESGRHQVRFEASGLPNGLYFSVLQAGSFRQAQRLVLMK